MQITDIFPKELDGYAIDSNVIRYDYDGIFRYMDGAGEVYRMFAYNQMCVATYNRDNAPDITVEIFDMGKPSDAYGIFLHSSEENQNEIGQGSDYRNSVLMFWKGKYFVNLLSEEVNDNTKETLYTFGKSISSELPVEGEPPDIINLLPEENRRENSLKFFHLHTSLNYHYYLSPENILNLTKNTDIAYAEYGSNRSPLIVIDYKKSELANSAYRNFLNNYIPEGTETGDYEIEKGKWVVSEQYENYLVINFDAPGREHGNEIIDKVKSRLEKVF